jgi:hypothetical protein
MAENTDATPLWREVGDLLAQAESAGKDVASIREFYDRNGPQDTPGMLPGFRQELLDLLGEEGDA